MLKLKYDDNGLVAIDYNDNNWVIKTALNDKGGQVINSSMAVIRNDTGHSISVTTRLVNEREMYIYVYYGVQLGASHKAYGHFQRGQMVSVYEDYLNMMLQEVYTKING